MRGKVSNGISESKHIKIHYTKVVYTPWQGLFKRVKKLWDFNF